MWFQELANAKPSSFALTVVSYRQDATNSSVWNRSKLTALEAECCYAVGLEEQDLFDRGNIGAVQEYADQAFSTIKRLSDVLPVADGSGRGTVALTLKMISALGVPTWYDWQELLNSKNRLPKNGVIWFCCTTDRGSNESQARKHILQQTADMERCLFLDGDCFEHQCHLGVLSGLCLLDDALKLHGRPWKYYSSLAIFSACARDLSNDLFKVWEEVYGATDALKHAKKLIPRSSAGRWGCVDSIETRILAAPFSHWANCMTRVILKKLNLNESELRNLDGLLPNDLLNLFATTRKGKPGKRKTDSKTAAKDKESTSTTTTTSGGGAVKVDVLAVEQVAEYAARIGKWRRHCVLTFNDSLFGRVVKAANLSRAALIHTSNFLKQSTTPRKLFELVCHKAHSIMKEFDDLLVGWS